MAGCDLLTDVLEGNFADTWPSLLPEETKQLVQSRRGNYRHIWVLAAMSPTLFPVLETRGQKSLSIKGQRVKIRDIVDHAATGPMLSSPCCSPRTFSNQSLFKMSGTSYSSAPLDGRNPATAASQSLHWWEAGVRSQSWGL